jgi:hypothetical protein
MDNFVDFMYFLLFLLIIAIAILFLGWLIASIYLIYQILKKILPFCAITIAAMLTTQVIYLKCRINALRKSQATKLYTPELDVETGKWYWKYERTKLDIHTDANFIKFVSLLIGISLMWFFFNRLHNDGFFSKQIFWFLWHEKRVTEQTSILMSSALSALMILPVLIKVHPVLIFRRSLTANAGSFVSPEDRRNLDQVNNLWLTGIQFYEEGKREIQGSDMSLIIELETIHEALFSEALFSLVENKKWQEFNSIMSDIIADLHRLKNTKSQAWNQTNNWGTNAETDAEKAYKILGLSPNATFDEVRNSYRRMANFYHPDHGGDPTAMTDLNWAYDTLKKKYQYV